MRLLLDENLPKRLKLDFLDHEIFTVRDKGWNGIKNGQLLSLLLENNFDALFTFDKNLSVSKQSTINSWANYNFITLKLIMVNIKSSLPKN